MRRFGPLLVVFALTLSCGEMPDFQAAGPRQDGIVGGTRTPQNTCLGDGEILSVVYLADTAGYERCSGTLVHQRVVVTAKHCTREKTAADVQIGFGMYPDSRDALIPVLTIHEHPSLDLAAVVLDRAAADELPAIIPIAMNREAVGAAWVDRWVDASGYGQTDAQQQSSAFGRFFASVQVYEYDAQYVGVDGHGEQGICYGDSGGPILWQPSLGAAPVVVGAEESGDASCVDRDHLTRVDLVAGWIDAIIAGLPAVACGTVDSAGECQGDTATWCESGYLRNQDCGADSLSCGYLGPAYGERCLPSSCGDLDFLGECDGDTLRWCTACGLHAYDCSQRGQSCAWVDSSIGYDCVCPMCGGVCTDISTSTDHCGQCDNPCSLPNANVACRNAVCTLISCLDGYENTNGNVTDGCETQSDPEGGCNCRAAGGEAAWGGLGLIGLLLGRRRRWSRSNRRHSCASRSQ